MSSPHRVKSRSTGPFAPPLPSEVEETDGPEPMAVANDKQTKQDESFSPTTAPMDAFSDEVAQKYRQVPSERPGPSKKMVTSSRAENRAQESPEGYASSDAKGWARPQPEDEEEGGE